MPQRVLEIQGGRLSALGAPDVTRLLLAWRDGDSTALHKLVPLVYA